MLVSTVGPYSIGPVFRLSNESNGIYTASYATRVARGFLVTWSRSDRIFARLFNDTGHPMAAEFPVSSLQAYHQTGVEAVALEFGFVVVWTNYMFNNSNADIYIRLFNPDTTPKGPDIRVNTWTKGVQGRCRVAALPSGFVVAYQSQDLDGFGVGVAARLYHNNGSAAGDEFLLNMYSQGEQAPTGLAATDQGFVPVWFSEGHDGDGYGVVGRVYNFNGSPLTEEFLINRHTMGSQWSPGIAAYSGGFFVVWQSQGETGESPSIYGQLFANNATRLGPVFRISDNTTADHSGPRPLTLPTGFFVVWSSSLGITGQLLSFTGVLQGPNVKLEDSDETNDWAVKIGATGSGFVVIWQHQAATGPRATLGRVFISAKTEALTSLPPVFLTTPQSSNLSLAPFPTTMISAMTSTGTVRVGPAFSPSDTANAMISALVVVIVGLALSLCASLGLYLYHRCKYTNEQDEPDQLQPVYNEAPDDSSHQYVNLRVSRPSSHYQDPPVPRKSTPDDYDSFRVVDEENPKY